MPPPRLLVIGCGNADRGDDGVGPAVVRRLNGGALPDGVVAVEAGPSSADVALQLRGAARVVVVDACRAGGPAGTVYRVRDRDVARARAGIDSHRVRWDDALALGRAVLGDDYPADVTVLLVEATAFEPGAPLSPAVDAAAGRIVDELRQPPGP